MTIPPPDAYPIITPDQAKSDDLEPGLYWIRGDDEADWPAQCLPEVIVYATPDDGQELADDEFDDLMDEAPQGEEEAALAEEIRQARTQRKFELLREFCSEFVTREVPPVVNATDPDSPAETLAP